MAYDKPNTEPLIRVTIITSNHGPINKTIDVGPDGKLVSSTDSCRVWAGKVETSEPVSLSGFSDILWRMKNNQAEILGRLKPEYTNGDKPVPVVTKKKLVSARKGSIARTLKYFEFPADVPHLLLVDFDRKQMTDDIAARIEAANGVENLLHEIFPELGWVGRVTRNSASTGLAVNGVPVAGGGGRHIFYLVADGSDIPRVIETMHKRLVNMGLGWIYISKSGARLLRSPVDAAVNKPNGLSFEGAPVLGAGLTQDSKARKPIVFDGPPLDSRAAFPVLTAAEHQQFEICKDNLRAKAAKPARLVSETYDRNLAKEIAEKTGKAFETVLRQVRMRHQQKLAPDWILEFDHLGTRTVADVTADPAKYANETLADPLEGLSSDRNKAMVMLDKTTGVPFINSYAHGGARYELMLDESAVAEAIDRADAASAVDVLAELLPRLMNDTGAVDRLKNRARIRAGVGKAAINARLKPELAKLRQGEEKAERESIAAEQEAAGDADDPRPAVPAPLSMSPRGAIAELLDRILADVKAAEPPVRNSEGRLLKIVEQAIPGMHELRDDDASDEAEADPDGPADLPAPPLPSLHVRDADEVGMLVEQHMRLMGRLKGGGTMEVALDPTFCHALNKLEGRSAMPVVRGVTTMPVVVVDEEGGATLRMPVGLDRETGVIFRIEKELRSVMPMATPTPEEARQAYLRLRDDWLCDVCTDEQGKATLIAMALTIIQRHDFTERPDFILSGAKAGTGKTTSANMVSMAVLGHRAAATAWSSSVEERRKSLFAILRAGTALVVFDNLKRGAEINDETVEKVQTSRRYSDRRLGESEQVDGDAFTVMVWTGHKIGPKADSASRNLVVTFATSYVRPSERPVKREDPVGWTLKHRAKILGCLYALLMSDRKLSPDMQAPTRFKAWWRAIARPIELAAEGEVSFADAMADIEANDTEELAVENLIRVLYAEFGEQAFRAAAAARLFEWGHWHRSASSRSAGYPDPSYGIDQFKHDLIESTTGVAPETWNAVELGKRLRHIADRAVRIDSVGEVRLTGERDRNGIMSWRVEVLTPRAVAAASE